ncbi:MAG: hypothetical protein L6R42_006883 [Xanthoria sp. 1 TBL-2021]|nr:MAG: hypothetical protein L6R42_006883 [Xanthoria sp. 1 TBL-2021]
MAGDYPLIVSLAMWLMPKSLAKAKEKSDNYARDTVMKRVNDKKKHRGGDFMDSMLSHRGEKEGLSDIELISNGTVLILAGSETTATLLSGVTYWLLRTPAALRKVTDEVRSAFASEDNINFHNATERLPYMLACLEEGLRKYPPIPSGLPRWTPRGTHTQIAGHQVPQKLITGFLYQTIVSVHMSAAYWSPRNFYDPAKFHPERWLPESTDDPSSPFYNDNRAVLQPFGIGPRGCIGRNLAYKEMWLILARVPWNFDIELCEESGHWNEQKTYVLWEKPALMCRLRDRAPSK